MFTITLCHYTDPESAYSINMSKMIYTSIDTIMDARWGPGTYFTDLSPYNSMALQIAHNNWGMMNLTHFIKKNLMFCIMIEFPCSEI